MGKRGRPTKYKKEYADKVRNYYKECLEKNLMPFIQDIALLLKVSKRTINYWSQAHEDFLRAIEEINTLQEKGLLKMALTNPNNAIFLLKTNHGYIEKQHLIHTGGTEDDEPIQFVIGPVPVEPEPNILGK